MRREVRLLGDILGEIIRDSGGPGLLADVERLRHAVIEARHGDHDAGDEIAGLVASWSLERAEQVARAFAVYFHLANLAEEHQRIRNLRERDTGTEPVRESLAAAVAGISHDAGPEHLRELHEQIDLLWRTSPLREGDGPHRRGPHGDDSVRRDAVPGRCLATPTRPRSSARPAPPCGSSIPRPGWLAGLLRTGSG
jgi:hypothetical protein